MNSNSETVAVEIEKTEKEEELDFMKKKRLKLSRALAVLAIKPSTFYSLHNGRKESQLRNLLEVLNFFQFISRKSVLICLKIIEKEFAIQRQIFHFFFDNVDELIDNLIIVNR